MKSVTYNQQRERWVVLYNRQQYAYHVETEREYSARDTNGYEVVATAEDYDKASAIASKLIAERKW